MSEYMSDRKFRILCLDGGGIRGVITSMILEELERQIGQPLNQYFDLIAGTSTGSIVAAGLVEGLTASQLLDIYEKQGDEIFSTSLFRKTISSFINQPKYPNNGLKNVLEEHLGGYTFSNLHERVSPTPRARLLILAYNTMQRSTQFFLSPLVDENPWYKDANIWEACVSSASAPTFFPPYQFQTAAGEDAANYTFVDGGVSANNPSLAALVHSLDIEKQPLHNISILSIGTGRTTKPLEYEDIKEWGLLNWATRISDVFMGGQIQVSSDLCGQLICSVSPNNYLRLQFEMNQRFDDQNHLLPKEKQVNRYTKKPLKEAMDDATDENIAQLKEATQAFLQSAKPYRSLPDGRSLTVKAAITNFIQNANPTQAT
jgi:uncharacterized protein